MTGEVPSSVALRAAARAPAIAWLDSDAGTMPSARANSTPAAKASRCLTAIAFIRPSW